MTDFCTIGRSEEKKGARVICKFAGSLYLNHFSTIGRSRRKKGPDNLQVCRKPLFEPLFRKMFTPTRDGPGNLQVCRTLIFDPENQGPVRPSASLQNRVYLPTIDAFLQKFAVRCGSATLLAPVPSILHTASTKAFSAASRPPLVPKFCTALLRRLFFLLRAQVRGSRTQGLQNSADALICLDFRALRS